MLIEHVARLISIGVSRTPSKFIYLQSSTFSEMSDSVAPDSPLVTYHLDTARPGYNYTDYYPDSPDPIYVPVPGDEGFVDQMTDLEIAERSEFSYLFFSL
jgi:hypothetical protein